ncbi:MAG: TonB-dependent receptor domain-containing protein [Parcubacteria group bacterium]
MEMNSGSSLRARLLASVFSAGILTAPMVAHAADQPFNIAPQSLDTALADFSRQSMTPVLATPSVTGAKQTPGYVGTSDPQTALAMLLQGTGLTFRRQGDTYLIVSASDPQSGSAAGDGADGGTVAALIVTAQKREENIQDVPIAMSAFTQEDLTRSQVAGGPDLMTQVPNFTFTKTNFSGYSIQIRGIGTQAISATTDAAVAVAFNNTPFIRNRFFEQEFYDLQRVEVLRGPQGTLYGRNATAGVVNLISAKPKFSYEAKLSADVGNYNSTRLEGMINVPLVEDKVALRLAGAWTKRDGYDTNQITGNRIDGRDLWSTRLSLRFEPTDHIHANLIWEHFQEDDDRLRSGKQLCHTHEVTNVGGFETSHYQTFPGSQQPLFAGVQATFSQGCAPASLYAPESFHTPNGVSLPYYLPLGALGLLAALDDPYVSRMQSRDLRSIESTVDPRYRAKTDIGELQISFDLAHDLTLTSEATYLADRVFSLEDYNRFNTAPGAWVDPDTYLWSSDDRANLLQHGDHGGLFCDPQIGCSDRLVAIDVSKANSRQFSEELRLSSNYAGALNFSIGGNFLRYDTDEKYYVFINSLSLISARPLLGQYARPLPPYQAGVTDGSECLLKGGLTPPDPATAQDVGGCVYIDPNPIGSLNDLGHNYFLSKNPYKLISYALFGEGYYQIADNLKLTAGLRFTVDAKEAPSIPSWVLASDSAGYPIAEVIRQKWSKPTGRLAVDWKPTLTFTDETLLYASVAHGYKAGGANPPPTGTVAYGATGVGSGADVAKAVASKTHPETFDPEYVNALEVGTKNTLLDGRLVLNGDAFYYDYTGYQISQIVDRSAVNLNFDARIWGVELEADWRPAENLRLGFKGGYENTRVADGMKAVDLMDRTAGHDGWVVVRPFPTYTSNCIAPASLWVGDVYATNPVTQGLVNVGFVGGGTPGACEIAYSLNHDPITDAPYVDLRTVQGPVTVGPLSTLGLHPDYIGWDPTTAPNHGEGFDKNLSGHELPNAPHFTATVTADYTVPLANEWLMTLHSDFYYQSEAWARIFNTPGYDKLKAYTNVNLAAILSNEDAGWKVMAYGKNLFDHDAITGAFLNSDDTGLTTNVFLNEPRLYGLRVTKEWAGEGWWTGANPNHSGPYPLTVEVSGQVQRQEAPDATLAPSFAGTFPGDLNTLAEQQHRDLDLGDGRDVTLVYRPHGGAWNISGGIRYGRTNGATRLHAQSRSEKSCAFPLSGMLGQKYCNPGYQIPGFPVGYFYEPTALKYRNSFSDVSMRTSEEHTVADFEVGYDVGLGGSVAIGLRYGGFKSSTRATMSGIPDWVVPDGWFEYPASFTRHSASTASERRFSGAGPIVSWVSGKTLWGDEIVGQVDLDWAATGGILFGRQKTTSSDQDVGNFYTGMVLQPVRSGDPVVRRMDIARSSSASVPVLDLSLGLSYDIQRLKLSTGYRWERYFNAIDGGYAEHKSYDRTFDGPYFKIAVGFGG